MGTSVPWCRQPMSSENAWQLIHFRSKEILDEVTARKTYRDLFPSSAIVKIGLETAPEGWAGGMLVLNDAYAQCSGFTIDKNQYDATINSPYSVNRYARAISSPPLRTNHNVRDGAML